MSTKLLADDVVVWTGNHIPTQREVDQAAREATERGWNGTTLDLCVDDRFLDYAYPSENALS